MKTDMKNKTIVVGIGRAGIGVVNLLMPSVNDEYTEFLSIDSDRETLKKSKTPHKIKIGYSLVHGTGCNQNQFLGKACLYSNKAKINNFIKGSVDIIILTGLGGGVGSGSTIGFLQLTKKQNIYTRVICSKPFSYEGNIRNSNARTAYEEIRQLASKMIIPKIEVPESQTTTMNKLYTCLDMIMRELAYQELNEF